MRADKQAEKQAQGTYKAFLNKMQPITPFLIADLIAKEGVHTDENGMHAPYRDSKGIPTIGFGSTVLKDGSRVTMNTPPITMMKLMNWRVGIWKRGKLISFFIAMMWPKMVLI